MVWLMMRAAYHQADEAKSANVLNLLDRSESILAEISGRRGQLHTILTAYWQAVALAHHLRFIALPIGC